MSPAVQCLVIVAIIAFFFVTELLPLAVTSMAGCIAVGLAGLIPIKTVFSGLSNATVVLFAGMFVVGAAMFHTGVAQKIGEQIVKVTGTAENSVMAGGMGAGAVMSAFLSNTSTAASLLPVIQGICSAAKLSPQRQLMPMAFGCGMGGIITLVGTPPNILASGALENVGMTGFGFFEFAWIGIPITVAGILYMILVGKRFLPAGDEVGELDEESKKEAAASTSDSTKQVIVLVTFAVAVVMMA